jgi:pimeloyl-ACP methyl ester carboxylesterase
VVLDVVGSNPIAHPERNRRSERSELVIFEQSSHLAFIEERERYVGVVADFLARADRDAHLGS